MIQKPPLEVSNHSQRLESSQLERRERSKQLRELRLEELRDERLERLLRLFDFLDFLDFLFDCWVKREINTHDRSEDILLLTQHSTADTKSKSTHLLLLLTILLLVL